MNRSTDKNIKKTGNTNFTEIFYGGVNGVTGYFCEGFKVLGFSFFNMTHKKEIVMKKLFFTVLCFCLLLSGASFAQTSTIGIVVGDVGGSDDQEVALSWYHQMDFDVDGIVSYSSFMRDLRALLLAADTDASGTLTAAEAQASAALVKMVDIQCDVQLTWQFWEMLRDCVWAQISTDEDPATMSTTEWFTWVKSEQPRCTPECTLPSYDDCAALLAADGKKIVICHIPPGKPEDAHTTEIAKDALEAHLAHGDYCGPCVEDHFGTSSQFKGE